MNIKKFSIFSTIILSVMVIACIICCFITIPTPMEFVNDPTSITVYDYSQSTTGITASKTNTKSDSYYKLLKAFKDTTTLTVFQRIASGANIYKKPSQDLEQKSPTWSSAKGGKTIEMSFNEKESMIVYVDGNSKKIDFYGLAMVVSSSRFIHEVCLYFKTTANGTYSSAPIIIQMNTRGLYNLIKSIDY